MIFQSLLHCAGINSFATLYGARSTDEENERAASVTSAVYNNMAACYTRQAKWNKTVYAATKTLTLAPKNLKALYRRAEANLELGHNQLAAKDIDLALDMRPEGKLSRLRGSQMAGQFPLTTSLYCDKQTQSFASWESVLCRRSKTKNESDDWTRQRLFHRHDDTDFDRCVCSL